MYNFIFGETYCKTRNSHIKVKIIHTFLYKDLNHNSLPPFINKDYIKIITTKNDMLTQQMENISQ